MATSCWFAALAWKSWLVSRSISHCDNVVAFAPSAGPRVCTTFESRELTGRRTARAGQMYPERASTSEARDWSGPGVWCGGCLCVSRHAGTDRNSLRNVGVTLDNRMQCCGGEISRGVTSAGFWGRRRTLDGKWEGKMSFYRVFESAMG